MSEDDKYRKPLYNEVHIHCYGSSKCAQDLVKIVNGYNDKHIVKNTGRLLANFNARIKDLMLTTKYTETWIIEFTERYLEYIKTCKLPEDVETRICNLCSAKFKQSMDEIKKRDVKKKNKWGLRNTY